MTALVTNHGLKSPQPAYERARAASFAAALTENSASFKRNAEAEAGTPKTTVPASRPGEKDNPEFSSLRRLVESHKLKLNNDRHLRTDTTRLVFVFGGNKHAEKTWPNYRFGITQIGDGNGIPLTITIPGGTSYAKVEACMNEIRDRYLDGRKSKSISLLSHGYFDGWAGSVKGNKFPLSYKIFNKIADFSGEDAPFYLHTDRLELTGCVSFGDLDAEEIAELRKIALLNNVIIIGNTALAKATWGYENGKEIEGEPGPGGCAYAFIPNQETDTVTIAKILRPRDEQTMEKTKQLLGNCNLTALEQAWKDSGSVVIDERKDVPNRIIHGSKGKQTVVHYGGSIKY